MDLICFDECDLQTTTDVNKYNAIVWGKKNAHDAFIVLHTPRMVALQCSMKKRKKLAFISLLNKLQPAKTTKRRFACIICSLFFFYLHLRSFNSVELLRIFQLMHEAIGIPNFANTGYWIKTFVDKDTWLCLFISFCGASWRIFHFLWDIVFVFHKIQD